MTFVNKNQGFRSKGVSRLKEDVPAQGNGRWMITRILSSLDIFDNSCVVYIHQ